MEPYQFVYAGHLSGILRPLCFLCKGRLLLDFFDIKLLYIFLHGKEQECKYNLRIKKPS